LKKIRPPLRFQRFVYNIKHALGIMNKISDKPLATQVAEEIRRLIRANNLVSGQRLSEQRLCERLGVSRTPLREALRILSAEGLVTISPNKGARVAESSIEDTFHMFEAMGVLEGSCARLAAERLTDTDLETMESLHEQLEISHRNGDPESYMSWNREFHEFVQEKAGNPVLGRIVSGLRDVILLHRYRQIYRPGRFDESMEEHRRLIEAFRARDSERAERLMQTHLQKQCQALITYYAEKGKEVVYPSD
jgi:DNA-binding GntR family transcriptional regulator